MRTKSQNSTFFKTFFALSLIGFCGFVSATPNAPPLLCIDGGNCVESEPDQGVPAGSYTLSSIGAVPFEYSTPVPPAISSEAVVTPSTIEANKVNGRRIILSPGNYGEQVFATQDQEIVFQPGANMTFLTVRPEAARLKFRGSPLRAGSVGYISVGDRRGGSSRDIMFDGVNQVHVQEGGQWPRQRNTINAQRIAFINSSFQAREFVAVSFSTQSARLEDAVFANNNMVDDGSNLPGTGNGEAAIRLVGAARVVFVDNRLYGTPTDAYQNFRIHAQPDMNAEDFYLARNQFEGTGHSFQRSGDGQQTMEILNIIFEDNDQYTSSLTPINVDGYRDGTNYPTTFTMRNNRLFSSGSWPSIPSGFSWNFSGNTRQDYQPPPVWQFR